jgi:hypothetical protein
MGFEEGISNFYIDRVLLEDVKVENYRGCFSSDNLPVHRLLESNEFSFIFNLAPAGREGSHFIAAYSKKKEDSLVIVDSLAQTEFLNYPTILVAHLKLLRKKILFRPRHAIQHMSSNFCGYFAMLAVLRQSERGKGIKLISFRRKSREKNDDICIKNIVRIIRGARK